MKRIVTAVAVVLFVGACNDQPGSNLKAVAPIPAKTVALMSSKGMAASDPVLVRVYKKESELEVWKRTNGQYALLKTYPICRWSGQLGPKVKEGDRQAPEGFYTVTPALLNPNSSFYLSFDTGYPNAFDRSQGRTGSHLMVHGDCSSRGCYAMTDEGIAEVYAIARESFAGGQRSFQFQAYPFRMNAENLAKYRQDPHMAFWKNLKQGSDHFEITKREPKVSVCGGRYAFNTVGDECKPDPTLEPAVAQKEDEDRRQVAELVAKGVQPVRLVYADGGQHETFKGSGSGSAGTDPGSAFAILDSRPARRLGEVSRPEALAEGPREIALADKGLGRGPTKAAAGASQEPSRLAAIAPRSGGRAVVASADPDDPVVATQSIGASKPLYDRLIGSVFGGDDPAAKPTLPAGEPPAAAKRPASPKPIAVVTPLRGKPETASPARPAAGAGVIAGAQPIGPTSGAFGRN